VTLNLIDKTLLQAIPKSTPPHTIAIWRTDKCAENSGIKIENDIRNTRFKTIVKVFDSLGSKVNLYREPKNQRLAS